MMSPSFSVSRGRPFSTLAYHLFLPWISEAIEAPTSRLVWIINSVYDKFHNGHT